MTRSEWDAKKSRGCGGPWENPDALYWAAFRCPDVVEVISADPMTTGLWQDVTVRLNDGKVAKFRLFY